MKLYTEEQVKQMLMETDKFTPLHIDYLIQELTPIELPSVDDLQKEADNFYQLEYHNKTFVKGGRFVLNKIQGGNK
jgi:hypothetical protein